MLLFATLGERLSQVNVIIGIIFCVLGLATILLAKKITFAIRKSNTIEETDIALKITRTVGLTLLCVGMVIAIVS